MRYLCDYCMNNNEVQEVSDSNYPKYTILGSILGAAAGLFMGQLVLIPVSIISGALIDKIKCDLCGSNENVFEVMEQTNDNQYVRIPINQFEDQNPLDDQIWIDETKQEFYFNEDEGMLMESQESIDIDSDSSSESVGFDGGFESGFDGGEGGSQ